MADDLPADCHAKLMRELDEHIRDALIFACDNCIDGREYFERASLDGHVVTMPHPWHPLDCDDDCE